MEDMEDPVGNEPWTPTDEDADFMEWGEMDDAFHHLGTQTDVGTADHEHTATTIVGRYIDMLQEAMPGEDMQSVWQRQNRAAFHMANLCQNDSIRRELKDELYRLRVVEILVARLATCRDNTQSVQTAILRALADCIYDHPGNAEVAANCGLKVIAEMLHSLDPTDPLTENFLGVINNVIGTCQTTHKYILDSGIVQCLVRLARMRADAEYEGSIATAALANLSNNPAVRNELIIAGAVDALAGELLQLPAESELDENFNPTSDHPTSSYMQSLSAVVKIVGGDSMMGKASLLSTTDQHPFIINGNCTTRRYDLGSMATMLVDARSVCWMVQYLLASVRREPYPPRSKIYGTPWKVALSLTCIARGSRQNRMSLMRYHALEHLECALVQQGHREVTEQAQTEKHVIQALCELCTREGGLIAGTHMVGSHAILKAKTLAKLQDIAAGRGANKDTKVRAAAADLMLKCGEFWKIERFLWMAALKDPAHCGLLSCLQPSMIRVVMRHFVMQGGTLAAHVH